MVFLLLLGILAVAAAAAGLVALTRDGYGRIPTRPGTPPAEREPARESKGAAAPARDAGRASTQLLARIR